MIFAREFDQVRMREDHRYRNRESDYHDHAENHHGSLRKQGRANEADQYVQQVYGGSIEEFPTGGLLEDRPNLPCKTDVKMLLITFSLL